MKTYRILVISSLLFPFGLHINAQNRTPKRRADSFFGVHFDFHALQTDTAIGKTLTPQMVESFLSEVKPDFIQVDTKGHPGYASYPTKVGVAAPRIVKDPLKIFRQVTSQMGVGLYSHYSGIYDGEAVKNHPDWAPVNANGQKSNLANSIFSGYCDNYFIPQIEELSNYGIDGVWVDGDCWAIEPDFSPRAKQAYTSATGKPAVPGVPYLQFTRDAFHRYLRHYVSVLHKYNPRFQIGSNWAFSSYMPGPVDADVDYLSGDISNDDDKNVELEPRVFANQGKPWDLMIWGFTKDKNGHGHYWKSPRYLEQKGAMIIEQGGGYQVYINQNRDASLPESSIPDLKRVGDFCRAREPYCFKTQAIPQIALLYSGPSHNYQLRTLAAFDQRDGGNRKLRIALQTLLDARYSVQVLQEYNLEATLNKYPLLVIPYWEYLEPQFIKKVKQYVYNGGKLLVMGPSACHLFDISAAGSSPNNSSNGLPVIKRNYGKGVIAGINADVSVDFSKSPDAQLEQTVSGLVKQLFTNPIVNVSGSDKIHIAVNTKNNATFIHLVNMGDVMDPNAPSGQEFKLPPISDELTINYHSDRRPAQILLQPGNVAVSYNYNNGVATFKVHGVDIYSIVEIK
jgi:hypothetical protein